MTPATPPQDAEAEARRAYLGPQCRRQRRGPGAGRPERRAGPQKTALDKASRASRAKPPQESADLLQSLTAAAAVENALARLLTAETCPSSKRPRRLEKPLEEQYFAARQSADALTAEVQEKQAELASVSGGRWVYPHGDAATRVRDAVNAELKSRGMTPDAKIFCELLSVEDESWQDCVEACLGDRRFDILVPPAHYAAAKSAFVALRDKVGPISLLDTPSIRTANRKADAAPADSLAAQVRSENPLAAQYADTILRRIVCCDTPDTLENYPDSATRDLLRHHPFRLERLRTPQRYIGLDARRARAEALTKALDELTARSKEAAQSAAALKAARNSYQDVLHSSVMDELAALWDARAALEAARADCTAQEQKLAECRENPMLQQLYKEDEAREAAWDAARAAVETAGGDIRVCEKQLASCEAEQTKAEETARQAKDAADRFFAQYPLLEPLARERFAALSKDKGPRYAAQSAEKAQARLDDAWPSTSPAPEPAQKEYNTRYVCDHPLGLTGIEQYRAQHESLVRIDLERYAARLEQAQRDCKDRFRKDILFRMKDDIFNARRQFRELNKVMEQLTYGEEVYRFELGPSRDPQLAAFYQVIVDKGNQQMTDGDSLDNLAATADPVYERQVDELMEKIMADVDENTRARQEGRRPENVTLSDYVDYRTYLDYDIKVTNTVSGQQASLSRVSRDSSGGENQAPFYVAICASLLQIYQKS
ncbi:MAG: SbcC/MukB-like Walker B domain-containing protein, partial [Faecalibacterium prausnitzii]